MLSLINIKNMVHMAIDEHEYVEPWDVHMKR